MNEIECACAQQPALWITVENPVDKPVSKNERAMSLDLKPIKELTRDIQEALLEALDILTARVDALEHDISTILGIVNSRPAESLERLRALKEAFEVE